MSITVYGSNLCPGTMDFINTLTRNHIMPSFVNVTGSIGLLKEFINFRDTNPVYDDIRGTGRIGFPLIKLEDGTYTRDVNAVLKMLGINEHIEYNQISCTIKQNNG